MIHVNMYANIFSGIYYKPNFALVQTFFFFFDVGKFIAIVLPNKHSILYHIATSYEMDDKTLTGGFEC